MTTKRYLPEAIYKIDISIRYLSGWKWKNHWSILVRIYHTGKLRTPVLYLPDVSVASYTSEAYTSINTYDLFSQRPMIECVCQRINKDSVAVTIGARAPGYLQKDKTGRIRVS